MIKIKQLNTEYGPDSKNELSKVGNRSIVGALAALESFYYGFNNKDLQVLQALWYGNDLSQLNNPVGGMLRGIELIMGLYKKIFDSQAGVRVTLAGIICYAGKDIAVFTGTETGTFTINEETIPLTIRTSRIFSYSDTGEAWFQIHHHGSISDAALLERYQKTITK